MRTPGSASVALGNSAGIDLDGNGIADFNIALYSAGSTTALLSFSAAGTGSELGSVNGITTQILLESPNFPMRFALGDTISAGLTGSANGSNLSAVDGGFAAFYGVRIYTESIGFFSLAYNSGSGMVRVADYAFESTPNTNIVVSVPEPSSLAAIAAGAVGLTLRRRRPALSSE